MDLATLRTRVIAKVGAVDDTTVLNGWINEGVTDFLLRTRVRIESGTATVSAGEDDFETDSDILLIEDCYVAGSTGSYPLKPVGIHDLLAMRQGGVVVASGPPVYYAFGGSSLMMFHPAPTATTQITFYYVPRPTTLTSDGNTPSEIPTEFHKAIELYACAEAADADDDQSSAQGERYRQQYDFWIAKARKYRNLMGNSRLPSAKLARSRGTYGRREDVYPA